MMGLEEVLLNYGINMTSQVVVDLVQRAIRGRSVAAPDELAQVVAAEVGRSSGVTLSLEGGHAITDATLKFMAEKGTLDMAGYEAFGKQGVLVAAAADGTFVLRDGTSLHGARGALVDTGMGARATGHSGSSVEIDAAGNITITAGKGQDG